jgi:hypothetical protein
VVLDHQDWELGGTTQGVLERVAKTCGGTVNARWPKAPPPSSKGMHEALAFKSLTRSCGQRPMLLAVNPLCGGTRVHEWNMECWRWEFRIGIIGT